ncbi:hypothetical protein ABZ860_41795 [Microbispora sp. NPDC046973]
MTVLFISGSPSAGSRTGRLIAHPEPARAARLVRAADALLEEVPVAAVA